MCVHMRMYVSACVSVRVLTCMRACVSQQKKKAKPRKSNKGVAATKQPVTEGGGVLCAVYECVNMCFNVYVCARVYQCVC